MRKVICWLLGHKWGSGSGKPIMFNGERHWTFDPDYICRRCGVLKGADDEH